MLAIPAITSVKNPSKVRFASVRPTPKRTALPVVKHYIDRALSAKTDNRPDFQQMIKDSEKRLFDIVLVWKLDRFARNRYDSAHYEYQLERKSCQPGICHGAYL